MEKKTFKILGGLAIAFILFSAFKNKTTTKKGSVSILNYQDGAPSGTTQVYSKVGTQVYDNNYNVIFTYDTAGAGMTMTGSKGIEMLSVVIGQNFMNGIPGFVFRNDVTYE